MNKIVIKSLIAILILSFICIKIITPCERTFINVLSIISTISTLVGLTISLWQIHKIATKTEEIKLSIISTKNSFNNVLSTIDVTKSINRIREIQANISEKELKLSLLKLRELKDVLVANVKSNTKLISNATIKKSLQKLTQDIINIDKHISDNEPVDLPVINKNLEHLCADLIEIQSLLKSEII